MKGVLWLMFEGGFYSSSSTSKVLFHLVIPTKFSLSLISRDLTVKFFGSSQVCSYRILGNVFQMGILTRIFMNAFSRLDISFAWAFKAQNSLLLRSFFSRPKLHHLTFKHSCVIFQPLGRNPLLCIELKNSTKSFTVLFFPISLVKSNGDSKF